MAQIRHYPLVSHVRGQASSQQLYWKGGALLRSGRGLSFFFRALSANIAEVPLDDRDLTFLFHGRTADFQDVTVQGVVTYRVSNAEAVANRIDFSLDLRTGAYLRTPLDQIADRLTQLAQQYVVGLVVTTTLADLLKDGVQRLRAAISEGFAAETALADMGLAIVSVRVSTVQPDAEMDKALQTPTRERIQQSADEATFARRALAVEKERAIAENELQNRIELARRTAQLVDQEGANTRRQAEEAAAAAKIAAEALAERSNLETTSKATAVRAIEGERLAIEKERVAAYGAVSPAVLTALAAREFAGRIGKIEHVNLSPDALSPFLADLAAAGARRLTDGDSKG
jgi:regulator of protease activity HflC (stomatin/prohibitin superfamily)